MEQKDLLAYEEKINNLDYNEKKLRDLHLRNLSLGNIIGPDTGYPNIDKAWLKYYPENAIMAEQYEMTNYELFYERNKEHPNDIALIYNDKKITYGEMFKKIKETAKALKAMGVKKGDIVSVALPTIPEFAYTFYALNILGAVINTIDLRTSVDGVRDYLNEANSDLLITFDMYEETCRDACIGTKVSKVVSMTPVESLSPVIQGLYKLKNNKKVKFEGVEKYSYNEFMKKGKNEPDVEPVKYSKNMPAAVVHTSGTTSKPKAITLTNENFNAMVLHDLEACNFDRQETFLNIVPPFVAYGLVNNLCLPLCLGFKNVLIPKIVNTDFPDLIMKYKPNFVLGIPMHWEILMNSPKMKGYDLSFLKMAIAGGDSLGANLHNRINEFFASHNCKEQLKTGYGMTEASAAVTATISETNKVGSVGIPFIKNNISIVDPETKEQKQYGEVGEIHIYSPSVMKEYYNNPTETKEVLVKDEIGNTYLKTGDLGYIDEDGSLFITGRIKRQIIRSGFKISPASIENIIFSNDAVRDCAVVGVDDLMQGHTPIACIVIKDEYIDNKDEILKQIKESIESELPDYFWPEDYEVLDEIPLTQAGKVDFMTLTEKENEKRNNSSKVK